MPDATPQPTDNTSWPSWFYPPETDHENPAAHGKVFDRAEDVPEGWLVDYRQHPPREAQQPAEIPFSRREMQAELTKRDIAFTPQTGRAELWSLLQAAVEAEDIDSAV